MLNSGYGCQLGRVSIPKNCRRHSAMCAVRLTTCLSIVAVAAFWSRGMAAEKVTDRKQAAVPGQVKIDQRDWPWWRGPNGDGIAPSDQHPPTVWSETENIAWSVPIPGRGHGSATVVGDQIVLATADREMDEQALVCMDAQTGDVLWKAVVHRGGQPTKGNEKSSLASSTPACDGTYYFITFLNGDSAWTTAVDRQGKQVWQTRICEFQIHQGFGASPAIYGDLVIVTADNDAGGAVTALSRATGEVVWTRSRPKKPNYTSPVILEAAGKTQLIVTGCNLVTSLDPQTGTELWEIEGATTECVTSTVTDGMRIFTSGGYPKNHIAAVSADGSGKVVWENPLRAYVPSLLAKGGFLFAVLDAGVATCLRSDTGEEVWKGRLGGTFSASPVMVGDVIYATNEAGQTHLFRASAEKFEQLGMNQLGDSAFATPVICRSSIYMRAAKTVDGRRQEMLYCIRQK
jgi:outer membrane protein assembly factor BamB